MFRDTRAPRRFFSTLISVVVLCLVWVMPVAQAGDMTPVSRTSLDGAHRSILDGQVFAGELGPLGKPAHETDSWVFDKGMFLSESCLECGFPESPYKVRVEEGKTHFETQTQCPRSDATIVWRGTVEDGQLEGVFTWVRKRWYWTIEKQFWFKGTLVDAPAGETTAALR